YDDKVGVILGLVPRIHLNNLDTRVKHEYDIKKEHKYDEEENLPEYDNNKKVMPIFCTAKNSRHLQINLSFLI
ncbi:MAG: hypothetical protein IJX20_01275, partial [Alphaproteobacteria bacterium]|nr:hypothetical protein [Alphaproteobacteria bacterium]